MAVKNRPTPEAGPREKTRVAGLDAIRLLCALWVTIGHSGFPLLLTEFSHGRLRAVDGLLRTLINGPAAVIVFFVISGFCIHFPYREGKGKPSLASFYTRRLLRITLPYVIAELLAHVAGIDLGGIAWSLVAEAIYYLLYPLFLQLRVRYGWPRLIIAAYVMAVAVILTRPNAGNYPSFTNALNWVVGMPCWLLGCLLAEQWQKMRVAAPLHLWGWRDGIIVLSFMASVLRWHVPHLSIGNPWTLDAFAIPVYFWLGREISYYQTRQPIQWLEKAGAANYSLYLVHLIGMTVTGMLLTRMGITLSSTMSILLVFVVIFVLTTLFYFAVEKPSHLLAVRLGKMVRQRFEDKALSGVSSQVV